MIIHLYTCCFNEIKILPFVVDYWKQTVDHVYVYDNFSNDGSYEFLTQYDWIDVIQYDSDNKLNDYILLDIKNNEWKKSRSKADFVIVCDLDECIYSKNLREDLLALKKLEVVGIIPNMYNLISKDFPQYDNNMLMHQLVNNYYFDKWEDFEKNKFGVKSKLQVFDPQKIIETNYKVGCYEYNPTFIGKIIKTDDICCYHLHDVGLYRKIHRYKERSNRMSNENIVDHLSDFYFETTSKIIKDFNYDLKNSKKII